MRVLIDSYNQYSQGAKNLARSLNVHRIRNQSSRYRPRMGDLIINWGRSNLNNRVNPSISRIINQPINVGVAANKKSTFQIFQRWNLDNPTEQINYPEYTDSLDTAKGWVKKGRLICSRSLLRSHSGKGMVIEENPVEAVLGLPTRIWTRYIRKSFEFRVHILNGAVIDVEWKRRRRDTTINDLIRSYANGWVFTRQGLEQHPAAVEAAKSQALLAVKALGLNFAGVDIVYSQKTGKATVLEANCAPGLQGATVQAYTNAIRGYIGV